ncbi:MULTISPECIES: ribonuclease J1 [Bacillus cereus group]|uniref:Ribonuclease J n=1 Tax=Bacillus luti TaxID=2026191 RepID=A0A7V7S2N0_9BACI|nr:MULTISPECIES: ribonuclease J [Bacillus cereus group]KAA6461481.1 ribonuclease J [Bacillus cereus]KAA6469898.1 ribonuclease J [Bacillus cereus]KAB2414144.1 ribonuclease J [Bacillus cereus]KAB2434274.1 ribonuclease J [Bacillus cereus]KAB2439839.1 ribonuclease J [Bacillus luti]
MKTLQSGKTKIFALGGLGEIGKNMYVIEYEDEIIIVDAGFKFPESELLGIDYVIPDYTYLERNKDKIKGLFITHGHEDHIGGVPFLFKRIQVPIYAGKLAAALIKSKFEEHNIRHVEIKNILDETEVEFQHTKVRFYRTTHSIPDAFGIVVTTPNGNIVHTGDFKFDFTPVGTEANLHKIAEIGKEGVLCLLSDSTNSEVPGFSMSEKKVGQSVKEIFSEAQGRILFATFASNVHRLQQVVEASILYNRKIAVVGRSIEKTIQIGRNLGYIQAPEDIFVGVHEINHIPSHQVTIICTGSQGEPLAALSRIAYSNHRQIQIIPGDTVVLSSSPIPGNVLSVNRNINQLYLVGANVIHHKISDIHTSGHGAQEEQKLMLSLLKPKYFIPIHGEYRMLKKHVELAVECGVPIDNCFVMDNGQVLEISKGEARISSKTIPSQAVYVDGSGIGDIGNIVLRDRRILSEEGIIIISLNLDCKRKRLVSQPAIVTRGFVYMRGSEELMKKIEDIVEDCICNVLNEGIINWAQIKQTLVEVLSSFLYSKTGRRPMILPIIMEV